MGFKGFKVGFNGSGLGSRFTRWDVSILGAGSGKREAGSGKREAGSGKREAGSGKREAEAGGGKPGPRQKLVEAGRERLLTPPIAALRS